MIKLNPAASITEEFAEKVRNENRNDRLMKLAPIFVDRKITRLNSSPWS